MRSDAGSAIATGPIPHAVQQHQRILQIGAECADGIQRMGDGHNAARGERAVGRLYARHAVFGGAGDNEKLVSVPTASARSPADMATADPEEESLGSQSGL